MTSTLMWLVDLVQSIQCGNSSFLLKYFSILCWLNPLWSLSFQAWLPTTQYLMGSSSDNVTCSLWPDLFLGPIIYLPSLILVSLTLVPSDLPEVFVGSCKVRSHYLGITSTLMRSVGYVQSLQCDGSSFLPKYFSIVCWLTSLWSLSS